MTNYGIIEEKIEYYSKTETKTCPTCLKEYKQTKKTQLINGIAQESYYRQGRYQNRITTEHYEKACKKKQDELIEAERYVIETPKLKESSKFRELNSCLSCKHFEFKDTKVEAEGSGYSCGYDNDDCNHEVTGYCTKHKFYLDDMTIESGCYSINTDGFTNVNVCDDYE